MSEYTELELTAAARTLERIGYIYCGGDEWYLANEPKPFGIADFERRIRELEDKVSELETERDDLAYKIECAQDALE